MSTLKTSLTILAVFGVVLTDFASEEILGVLRFPQQKRALIALLRFRAVTQLVVDIDYPPKMGPMPLELEPCFIFTSTERCLIDGCCGIREAVVLKDAFNSASLYETCNSLRVSTNRLFEVAWSVAIGVYTDTQAICFSVKNSESHCLIRCELDPTKSLADLIEIVQEIPWEKIETSHNEATVPCDTVLTFAGDEYISQMADNVIKSNSYRGSIGASPCINASEPVLQVQISPKDQSLIVEYPSVAWTRAQAEAVAQLLSKCITEFVENPHRHLSGVDLLPLLQAETIRNWNAKEFDTCELCIPDAIAGRTAAMPNNVAVCAWDGEYTYRELDILASQLGRKLYNLGVRRDEVMPFLFHKSKWTIVAFLGILKAGCAATALNPEFSSSRIEEILSFTNAEKLLMGRDFQPSVNSAKLTEIVVDEQLCSLSADNDSAGNFVSSALEPQDLAFIQFTSGSTGAPKAVMIEHRTYMANALSQQSAFRINQESRVLQFASHNFDALLVEVLTTLIAGGCICIPSEEDRMGKLSAAINKLQVNWMGITPTLAKILKPEEVPRLKTLAFWGEPATKELIEAWANSLELLNLYGPSENSVAATTHSFSMGIKKNPSYIGKSMLAVNTWIVRRDNRQLLAPIGTVGELVLQGPTVARGYLNDPARSAKSFQQGASWLPATDSQLHQRIYYTGDLVRYTIDGSIIILGRSDTQAKIRGHRIELGDIEHSIDQSPRRPLASAVELVNLSCRSEQKFLVAFIVPKNARHPQFESSSGQLLGCTDDNTREDAAILHDYLAEIFPQHSVPSIYLPLTRMPWSASGKADRKRLRDLASSLTESEILDYSPRRSKNRPPTTKVEILAAKLWADILGINAQNITLDDNFFWLGGNSILAMRLAVAARAHGLYVTVAQILKEPKLVNFASKIERPNGRENAEFKPYIPLSSLAHNNINLGIEKIAFPAVAIQKGNVEDVGIATDYQIENLAWSSLKQRGGTNYIMFDFKSERLDPGSLQLACERLVSYHSILRTVYCIDRRHVYQVVLKQLPYEFIHRLYVQDVVKTTSAIMEQDLKVPLDISRELIKFWLLRGENGVKRLVFRGSHLQYDGVTLVRWCKELDLAYRSETLYPTASFIGYMHFAANHDERGARAFWRKLLAGSSMTNVISHSSIQYSHVLDGQVETLVDSVRSHGDITIGTTIKAAWALVLAEMAGVNDVVFGSVVWGRNATYPGVENVAGACIDNIPVRVALSENMTRLQLLQLVQDQYFEAVTFESFQFKRIVSECTDWKPWTRLSSLVEYENMGEDTSKFQIDGCGFTLDEIRPPADRHDITIWSTPTGKQTFIALDFCKSLVPETLAQQMLDRLVFHITAFGQDLYAPLLLARPGDILLPRLPLCTGGATGPDGFSSPQNQAESNSYTNGDSQRHVRDVVDQAWLEVLWCRQSDLATFWLEDTPFFEVWGNLIAALGLAQWFTNHGYPAIMEDVLENPRMRQQVTMLCKIA